MLTPGVNSRIYLAAGATDLRKSYDTLGAIVTNALGKDPLSGHFFVFCNRARNRVKVLVFEPSGYWLFSKRLEAGTFAWPESEARSIELTQAQLSLLLGGIDLASTRDRKWYDRRALAQS